MTVLTRTVWLQAFSDQSLGFQEKILSVSGLGPKTYLPEGEASLCSHCSECRGSTLGRLSSLNLSLRTLLRDLPTHCAPGQGDFFCIGPGVNAQFQGSIPPPPPPLGKSNLLSECATSSLLIAHQAGSTISQNLEQSIGAMHVGSPPDL